MRAVPSIFAFPCAIDHVLLRAFQRPMNHYLNAPIFSAHGLQKSTMQRLELLNFGRLNLKFHQRVNHCLLLLRAFSLVRTFVAGTDTFLRSSNRETNSFGAARLSRSFHRASTGSNLVRRVDNSSICRSKSTSFRRSRPRTVLQGGRPARYMPNISVNSRSVNPASFAEPIHLRYRKSCSFHMRYPLAERSALGRIPIRS